ncbi:hypothetical protein BCV70DRAFT_90472 [Testicularia cyperi]|uniref:Uncharacterized protein n=1 Tax=Testicularia cyperi TaxID=1882483 RepID=A0A317XTC7_9BASI|nr:hypothetical protein BCV70DRAFT_90472 [Testicularia cyperi]
MTAVWHERRRRRRTPRRRLWCRREGRRNLRVIDRCGCCATSTSTLSTRCTATRPRMDYAGTLVAHKQTSTTDHKGTEAGTSVVGRGCKQSHENSEWARQLHVGLARRNKAWNYSPALQGPSRGLAHLASTVAATTGQAGTSQAEEFIARHR